MYPRACCGTVNARAVSAVMTSISSEGELKDKAGNGGAI